MGIQPARTLQYGIFFASSMVKKLSINFEFLDFLILYIHGMHISTNFGQEIWEKKFLGTNGLKTTFWVFKSSSSLILKVLQTHLKSGLGTLFFSVRYITFFSFLKKERSLLFRCFLEFLATYETQKNVPFFSKERKRTQRTFCSF